MAFQHPSRFRDLSLSHKTGNAAAARDTFSISLERFWTLPEELKIRIIALACTSIHSTRSGAIISTVDVATSHALVLASKIFSHQAQSLLWKTIEITRPTALVSLLDAIAASPELGLRIESLCADGENDNSELQYPVTWQRPVLKKSSSNATFDRCVCADFRWPGEVHEITPTHLNWVKRRAPCTPDRLCVVKAIYRAQQEIQRALALDPERTYLRTSSSEIYEAKAAYELYLGHLQDVENGAQCGPRCAHKGCFTYPLLTLTGFDTDTAAPSMARQKHSSPQEREWILTRAQILAYLCRPGSAEDTFDHPLRWDCSNFDSISLRAVGGPLARLRPKEGDIDTFAEVYQNEQLVRLPWYDGSSFSAIQCLLALTPRLSNLALSNSLFCALDGVETAHPKSLRALSLSPATTGAYASDVLLEFGGFKDVKSLHICGLPPWPKSVANVDGLEHLEEIRWTMTDRLDDYDFPFFGVILDALVGRQGTSADEAAAAAERDPVGTTTYVKLNELRARCFAMGAQATRLQEGHVNVSKPVAQCLVEVVLPPDVLPEMLNRAGSAAERAAWIAGQPLGSQGWRLLLSAGPASLRPAEGDDVMRKEIMRKDMVRKWMYEEVREWWERHCSL